MWRPVNESVPNARNRSLTVRPRPSDRRPFRARTRWGRNSGRATPSLRHAPSRSHPDCRWILVLIAARQAPERRRQVVEGACRKYGLLERQACRIVGQPNFAPLFSSGRRAMRFHGGAEDQNLRGRSAGLRERVEHVGTRPFPPTNEMVLEHPSWSALGRRIDPTAPDISNSTMPLITRRSSSGALPRESVGKCGWIFENCPSTKTDCVSSPLPFESRQSQRASHANVSSYSHPDRRIVSTAQPMRSQAVQRR